MDEGNCMTETHTVERWNEIALGEQFKGVDLNTKFDTELHKEKKYC